MFVVMKRNPDDKITIWRRDSEHKRERQAVERAKIIDPLADMKGSTTTIVEERDGNREDMKIYELASGDYLVTSDAGVQTIVFRKPFASICGCPGFVAELRLVADTVEAAGSATASLSRPGVCVPA